MCNYYVRARRCKSIVHHTPLFVLDSVYSVLHASKAHTLRHMDKRPSFSIAAKQN
jgi:hypothetical protein